jgi:hypothetical protein
MEIASLSCSITDEITLYSMDRRLGSSGEGLDVVAKRKILQSLRMKTL